MSEPPRADVRMMSGSQYLDVSVTYTHVILRIMKETPIHQFSFI